MSSFVHAACPIPQRRSWLGLLTSGIALALVAPGIVLAQTSPLPPPSKAEDKEILVRGRRLPAKRTLEGVVYSTADRVQGEGGSAVDLLNTIPSVHIAPDGRVTMRGSDKVRILIDGRPSAALNGPERVMALEALSGGSIESVELLTNPSVRYDANGGMILNIRLKKPKEEGLSGKLAASVGDSGGRTLSADTMLRSGRWKMSIDTALRQDVRLSTVLDDRRLLNRDGGEIGRFATVARFTPTFSRSASLTGTLSYAATANDEIGLEAMGSRGTPINTVFEDHRDQLRDGVTALYRRVRGGTYWNDARDVSLYYREKVAADRPSLSVEAQHSETGLRWDRPFTTIHDSPARPASGQIVLFRSRSTIDRVAIDHSLPLGKRWTLQSGAEWKREGERVANGAAAFDPAQAGALPMPSLATFDGVQTIAAIHAAAAYRDQDWAIEAGTRVEAIRITAATSPEATSVRRRVAGFAHRLSVTHDLGRDHLAFRVSRSRERIDSTELSPVVVTIDPQNLSIGNPLLRPQDVTGVEVEYGFAHAGFQATATLYSRRTDRLIGNSYVFQSDNVLLRVARNNGTWHSAGGEVVLSGPVGGTLRYSLTGNLRTDWTTSGDQAGTYRAALLSYSLQGSLDWQATHRDTLRVDADRQGPELIPLGTRTGTSAVDLVWRHKISSRWSTSLTARGLVQDSAIRTVIRTPLAIAVNDRITDTRAILFGLSHDWGRMRQR
ncbi:TonB-dependent receptor [Sphingomonas sp. 1185]|uniref:TonB-dependent receptor domain-containing protein n=1 Tax=Sphingomonas sp. 1185 TaxID=3156411 RepID=UPI00339A633A